MASSAEEQPPAGADPQQQAVGGASGAAAAGDAPTPHHHNPELDETAMEPMSLEEAVLDLLDAVGAKLQPLVRLVRPLADQMRVQPETAAAAVVGAGTLMIAVTLPAFITSVGMSGAFVAGFVTSSHLNSSKRMNAKGHKSPAHRREVSTRMIRGSAVVVGSLIGASTGVNVGTAIATTFWLPFTPIIIAGTCLFGAALGAGLLEQVVETMYITDEQAPARS